MLVPDTPGFTFGGFHPAPSPRKGRTPDCETGVLFRGQAILSRQGGTSPQARRK